MILDVSKYTDIPLFYSDWFINKLHKGYFSIFENNVNKVFYITPENFEVIVFHTKNAKKIINQLSVLDKKGFKYFFVYTISPYDETIEKNVGVKREILQNFIELSKLIGKEKVVWKYSPILFNQKYNKNFHLKSFESLCKRLSQYTNECIIDFIGEYNPPVHAQLFTDNITATEKKELCESFCIIAQKYGLKVYFKQKTTISDLYTTKRLYQEKTQLLTGLNITQDIPVMDIGQKNTCIGDCEYCAYGGNNTEVSKLKFDNCNIDSPQFIGEVNKKVVAKRQKVPKLLDLII